MENNKNNKNSIFTLLKLEHWRLIALLMMVYDVIFVNASYFFALLLRFDFRYSFIPIYYLDNFYAFAPIYACVCVIIFTLFKLYRSIWRYASYECIDIIRRNRKNPLLVRVSPVLSKL